jgi:hypothetical protein
MADTKYTLIKKELDNSILLKYLDKIRVIKVFHPSILDFCGRCSYEYELGKSVQYDYEDEQETIKKYKTINEKVYISDSLPESMSNAYMWSFKGKDEDKLDDIDKMFIKQVNTECAKEDIKDVSKDVTKDDTKDVSHEKSKDKPMKNKRKSNVLDLTENNESLSDKFVKHEFFGLHTYGGYYGFFRPDLSEVIHLINQVISVDDLDQIERMYVTTEPHPDDNARKCYDAKQDRHRAKTTCYVYKKKVLNKKTKVSNQCTSCEK